MRFFGGGGSRDACERRWRSEAASARKARARLESSRSVVQSATVGARALMREQVQSQTLGNRLNESTIENEQMQVNSVLYFAEELLLGDTFSSLN